VYLPAVGSAARNPRFAEDFRRKGREAHVALPSIPSYRLHRQSGQAIVTLTDGTSRRDFLLGPHGSAESRAAYARVLAEWEAAGRRLPPPTSCSDLSVNELILAYWRFAEGYYRKNGEPTSQLDRVRLALRIVRELYGYTPARDFGPKALKAVREKMLTAPCGFCGGSGRLPVKKGKRLNRRSGNAGEVCARCHGRTRRGWARGLVNSSIGCVKRMFKWAVAEEMVPPSLYHGLQAVAGLKKGRSEARETTPIRPVAEDHVDAVLPFLRPPVRALVQLQRLTGMRPGEAVILRPCDIDRSRPTWVYRPESHKTEHHGVTRVIFLGPQAREVLSPFLDRDTGAYCFSPRESVAHLRASQRGARKTKVQPSQRNRRRRKPKQAPGLRYSVDTYGNAVERACRKAGVPAWHVNQLRHTKATEIRRQAGLDTARAVLGHRSPAVTETYAEADMEKAAAVMERLG
jgi:integrase